MSKEWPLEGHFGCGGSGLFVTTDCLGRAFTSRTANYDLIIGLPQLSTVQRPRVLAPQWNYGPRDKREPPTKEMSSGEWHMGTPLSSSVAGTTQRSQPTTTNSSLPPTTS